MMVFFEFRGVTKRYGAARPVLNHICLSVQEGEFICIVGPSGAGKTTLISLAAGLVRPDAGEIILEGTAIRGPGPDRGVVFQNYSLLPWMSALENVRLGVDAAHPNSTPSEKKSLAEHYVRLVNLGEAMEKRPRELSGGMRQRVAVARCLATEPKVLLLDEPFSALDALTRATLQEELARIWMKNKKTVIMITNDLEEAILLADRIYPLIPGISGSRLGPPIPVKIPRPRDRRALSSDPCYQQVRKAIVEFLAEQRKAAARIVSSTPAPPPELKLEDEAVEDFLELSQLGKTYTTPQGPAVIVQNCNLRVREGEFVCLIGHSGCGKSTLLSMAMGLIPPSEGGVILAGREIDGPGTDRGVVFQSPSLLPWFRAWQNVLLSVELVNGRHHRMERRKIVEKYLALVGLGPMADRYPEEMSAGMKQRVGIARAFALEPKVLLLDEPFSLLDTLTRMELQDELMNLWEEKRKTVLMVTHDVDEALLLADRIAMMTRGPAATIEEVLTIPFPRPRRRAQVLAHPEYYLLRDRIISFLEGRIGRIEKKSYA